MLVGASALLVAALPVARVTLHPMTDSLLIVTWLTGIALEIRALVVARQMTLRG